MNRQQKEQVIEDLKGKLAENNVGVFTRYSGLKVLEINQIRNDLKKVSADYHVVKNTLFLRAIDGTEIAALKDHIHGPLALAVAKDDIVPWPSFWPVSQRISRNSKCTWASLTDR